MGKASSTKKVARAAKAGGRKTANSRQLGFPVAIAAVVILGLGLVTYARTSGTLGSDSKNHPRVGEHWHAAYGIFICDHFVTNVSDRSPDDPLGIHTHGDGLIHIHPFNSGAAGKQATLARFFDQTGLKASNSSVKLPAAAPFKGRTYKAGSTACGGKPAVVEVTHWKSALAGAKGAKPTRVFTKDFGKIRFSEDQGAYTIAFVPRGKTVPAPPGAADIVGLGAADAGGSPASSGAPPISAGTTPARPADNTAPPASNTP